MNQIKDDPRFPVTPEDILVWAIEHAQFDGAYSQYLAQLATDYRNHTDNARLYTENAHRCIEWLAVIANKPDTKHMFSYVRISRKDRVPITHPSLFSVSVAGIAIVRVDMRQLLSIITQTDLPVGAEGTTR
jgi:NRPS condensation-like uncharacterized protein